MTSAARFLAIATGLAIAPATAWADADPVPPASDQKVAIRLAAGVAYLHEGWSPNDGNAGAVQTGWAPALEIAVGRVLSPRLVVGGIWQFASLFSPTESFAGTDYHLEQVVKLVSLVGPFIEHPRLPYIPVPVRAGIAIGAVTSSFLDTVQTQTQTTLSLAASPYVGYDRRLSKRWSVGALVRVTLYRSVLGDTPPSASTTGVLPSLLAAFTFR